MRVVWLACALLALMSGYANAQTGSATAPLSGVVADKDGGVIPGATVTVKNNATGVTRPPVVTNSLGVFLVAGLEPGAYTVTVELQGFKKAVISDVKMVTATPYDIKVTMEVGTVSETVEVRGGTPIIQTQSTAISNTVRGEQIANLPLITKNALNYVTFLPSVDTGGTHSQRASTVAGLPQTAIGISIDGVNTQDNYNKSGDGFFSIITPSVDAIEEVTVTTATQGADSSGQGAVQIRFTTKSGTNRYTGSLYEYWRDPSMNTNTYFNKINRIGVNQIKLNQYGGNVGGPIVLPGMVDGRGKAFFFTNYEEFRQPSEITRTRTVMSPDARNGFLNYSVSGATQRINVLQVAAANGFLSSTDPLMTKTLADIAAATATLGSVTPNTDLNTLSYNYNAAAFQTRHFPTIRLDFNVSPKHRLSTVYNFQKFNSNPDTLNSVEPRFPGFSNHGSQYSYRHQSSASLRSTLSANVVNEATWGILSSPVYFFSDITAAQFDSQGGYGLTLAAGTAFGSLSPPTAGTETAGQRNASGAFGNNISSRNGSDWSLSDKLTWQRGAHTLTFGGEYTAVKSWVRDQQIAPGVQFGVDTNNDPANAMFTTANFPGASNTVLGDARTLYALLTGRVTNIQGQLALNADGKYIYNGVAERRTSMDEVGGFLQDAWRLKPTFTVNAGLRYELQLPVKPDTSVYSVNTVQDACGLSGQGTSFGRPCNLFMPGTMTGSSPTYKNYSAGTKGYDTDYNNFAPSIGMAWQPNVREGIGHAFLGDPDQATVRAAYNRAFTREGLAGVSTPFEANVGVFAQQVRSATNGNLVLPGETWPLLLRDTARMGPGTFAESPTYPIPITRAGGTSVNLYRPDFQVAYADSYSVGLQRSLSKDMAVEVRYVGTRGRHLRESENWNEVNIVENGFLDEFKKAQANLYANIAAGRGQSIAYMGPGTGTSPLPTYLAYINGSKDAGNAAAYSGTNWTNTTIVGRFASLNPNPGASAGTDLLGSSTFRANALTAGLPYNFFVMNPDATNVNVQVSDGYTSYDSLQVDFRRRLSKGLQVDANYVFAVREASRLDSLRTSRYLVQSTAGVPNALKFTTTYDLPFGRGKKFGADANGWVDGVAGGWTVNLTGKVQDGQVLNFGNVRLVGMTEQDLKKAIQYRIVEPTTAGDIRKVYNLPQDIIDNTIKAFSTNVLGYTAGAPAGRYLAPANGPDCIQVVRGDCAPKDLFVTAPLFTRFDFSAKKRFSTGGRTNFVFEVDVFNLFNAIDFNPTISTSTVADNYRVTSSYSDVNGTFDPGSRVGQLVLRFNW